MKSILLCSGMHFHCTATTAAAGLRLSKLFLGEEEGREGRRRGREEEGEREEGDLQETCPPLFVPPPPPLLFSIDNQILPTQMSLLETWSHNMYAFF